MYCHGCDCYSVITSRLCRQIVIRLVRQESTGDISYTMIEINHKLNTSIKKAGIPHHLPAIWVTPCLATSTALKGRGKQGQAGTIIGTSPAHEPMGPWASNKHQHMHQLPISEKISKSFIRWLVQITEQPSHHLTFITQRIKWSSDSLITNNKETSPQETSTVPNQSWKSTPYSKPTTVPHYIGLGRLFQCDIANFYQLLLCII
jgi:hypothetical protein